MTNTAIITGVTGQDGSYLADRLLSQNYKVIGLSRRSSTNTLGRISHLLNHPNLIIEEFDLTDPSGCMEIVNKHKPQELYNLAAMSHVATSFKQPSTTFQIDAMGVVNLLEAVRQTSPDTKFYQASTSEMFGSSYDTASDGSKYQNEQTALLPNSPYAVAKLASHRLVEIYRKAYNIFCCSGILFNHESPRRGENFVTRKITRYIADLVNNKIPKTQKLRLGNLDATRDWGHAQDYVRGMQLMLQQSTPQDFVLATGETRSVRDFLQLAFGYMNLDYNDYVVVDPEFYRPCEVPYLRGDASLAKKILGWSAEIPFSQLVQEMVDYDVNL